MWYLREFRAIRVQWVAQAQDTGWDRDDGVAVAQVGSGYAGAAVHVSRNPSGTVHSGSSAGQVSPPADREAWQQSVQRLEAGDRGMLCRLHDSRAGFVMTGFAALAWPHRAKCHRCARILTARAEPHAAVAVRERYAHLVHWTCITRAGHASLRRRA